ncbi:hypothetical protein RND81_08G060500 [Saponaria officinalis]|uniref:Uncharacterized protein n=1 Tax=Saponaria officinalis TaxID=3572 RepID=A0AAW1J5L6_SAPOF
MINWAERRQTHNPINEPMSPSPLRRMRNSINRALLVIFKPYKNHYKKVKRKEDIKSSQILSTISSSNKHYKIVSSMQGNSNQIQIKFKHRREIQVNATLSKSCIQTSAPRRLKTRTSYSKVKSRDT